jgi:hypothetical protein
MDYNEFSWERRASNVSGTSLSAADVETMAKLMRELREITLSRKTYAAATDFLRRFGSDVGASTLVEPDTLPN